MTAPGEAVADAGVPAPSRPRPALVTAVVVIVALAFTAIVAFHLGSAIREPLPGAASPEVSAVEDLSAAEVFEALAPSVVTIEMLGQQANTVTAIGTGVVVNADGIVLTALHVVSGSGSIWVTFADGTRSAADILAADPSNDIAALAASTLPAVVVPAVLGSAARLSVGDAVVAIGNPFGLTSSATAGVVSGLDRAATSADGTALAGLIQFDAAVNPGSSGGPLVNTKGETVGVVVALANPTAAGTFIGIGFAVPIGTAITAGGDGAGPQQ